MRVFVFEHMVGGGELHRPLPATLAAQGDAMLTAATAGFRRAGCEVVTTRDVRVEPAAGGAETFTLSPGEDTGEAFDRAAAHADAGLVIAPETDGLLAAWTRRLERAGVRSLGSGVEAIELCADKLALHDHLTAHEVPMPTTRLDPQALDPRDPRTRPGAWDGERVVAKPRVGAGCEHTHLLREPAEAAAWSSQRESIFQPWCAGRAVSVSLIVHGEQVHALAAGEQFVSGERVLCYEGGRLPLEPSLAGRATALAERAVRAVGGLRGFVGVDLVLGDDTGGEADVVLEINPRLTLSFVALTWVCEPTVAAALVDAQQAPTWSSRAVPAVRFDAAGRLAVEEEAV